MVKTFLINGSTNNQDTHLSKLISSIATSGIIEGLEVTGSTLSAGYAFIKCTRSGDNLYALFVLPTAISVNTTGTRKIYATIPQSFINSPETIVDNNVGSIGTGASRPTDPHVKIAEVNSGVLSIVNREEVTITKKRKISGEGLSIVTLNVNGEEVFIDAGTNGQVLHTNGTSFFFQSPTVDIEGLASTNDTDGVLIIANGANKKIDTKMLRDRVITTHIAGENIEAGKIVGYYPTRFSNRQGYDAAAVAGVEYGFDYSYTAFGVEYTVPFSFTGVNFSFYVRRAVTTTNSSSGPGSFIAQGSSVVAVSASTGGMQGSNSNYTNAMYDFSGLSLNAGTYRFMIGSSIEPINDNNDFEVKVGAPDYGLVSAISRAKTSGNYVATGSILVCSLFFTTTTNKVHKVQIGYGLNNYVGGFAKSNYVSGDFMMSMTAASADDPIDVVNKGRVLTFDGGLQPGQIYKASDTTPGSITPRTELDEQYVEGYGGTFAPVAPRRERLDAIVGTAIDENNILL